MAKKTTKTDPSTDDTIEDAIEVTPEPELMDRKSQDGEAVVEPVPDAEVVADSIPSPDLADEPSQPAAAETAAAPRAAVFPMIAAGAVCAALGFGAAYWVQMSAAETTQAALAESLSRADALSAEVSSLAAKVSELDIDGAVAGAEASATARLDAASAEISAILDVFEQRIALIEQMPTVDGGVSPVAVAALEQEIESLRSEIAGQQERMTEIASAAADQLEQTRQSAEAIEEAAAAASKNAAAVAALAQVRSAVETGSAYASALADLSAVVGPLPAALLGKADVGLPTLASLEEGFPDAARAALSAARAEGVSGEETGGIMAFLRNQFDIRSVQPKDGRDTDAILSRVGAALANGDLAAALAESETLPPAARSEMSDWLTQLEIRADALDALATLKLPEN